MSKLFREKKPGATRCFSTRTPGTRPPSYLVERLARLYPEVQLVWNYSLRRWQLVEQMPHGGYEHIGIIHDGQGGFANPTMGDTIYYLRSVDSRQFENKAQLDRWADELLDAPERAEEERLREVAHERAAEGTQRLEHAFGTKVSVSPLSSDSHG